jgi:hypothetical protein
MGTNKFAENKSMSDKTLEKAQAALRADADTHHLREAAEIAEDIIRMLSTMWGDRGMTPEQCVFALSLATINYRETLPDRYGGKETFDRVSHEAYLYYQKNK